jgi:hypothetical protein
MLGSALALRLPGRLNFASLAKGYDLNARNRPNSDIGADFRVCLLLENELPFGNPSQR